MRLVDYLTDTKSLIKDRNSVFWSTAELTRFVNQARYQISLMAGCIQILIPGNALAGASAVPSASGSGTAVPGGATPGSSNQAFQTITGQEKYSFGYANAYARAQNAHIKGIINVNNVSVNWGGASGSTGNRPMLYWLPWPDFQAYCRAWAVGVTSFPYCWSQFGDGERGQVWLFPIPNRALEMQWETDCAPADLATNDDYEALPDPFTQYVPFYAAHLAYLNSQRYGQAQIMLDLFEKNSGLARASSDRGKTPSMYGGGRVTW